MAPTAPQAGHHAVIGYRIPGYRAARQAQPSGEGDKKAFLDLGVPEGWIDVLIKLGYTSVEKLKEVEKPGKLANDLNGYRKKNKLDLPGLSPEAVAGWL